MALQYRVAKTHRMPYLYRSYSAKEIYFPQKIAKIFSAKDIQDIFDRALFHIIGIRKRYLFSAKDISDIFSAKDIDFPQKISKTSIHLHQHSILMYINII